MKRVALLFALILAMLVATVHPAEAASVDSAQGDGVAHVIHGDHEGANNDNGHDDQQGDDGIGHHHCPTCWIADATPRIKSIFTEATALLAARYGSLPSRSDDPLLEPPAA